MRFEVPNFPYELTQVPECAYKRGQKLKVFYPNIPHEGIVYSVFWNGTDWEITCAHNSKTAGGGVCLVSLGGFEQGCRVEIIESPSSPEHEEFIIHQVDRALAAGVNYFLLYQNCQHFTSWCYTGKAESQSLKVVAILFGSLALVGVAWADSLKPQRPRRRRSRRQSG